MIEVTEEDITKFRQIFWREFNNADFQFETLASLKARVQLACEAELEWSTSHFINVKDSATSPVERNTS
jgi:hypothetical protein